MNNPHANLHIVLTSKTKHAEFKCPLCRKIFISSYHLRCHSSRRHSEEEFVKEDEEDSLYVYRDSVQEKLCSRRILNASRRMEQLLSNLSIEEKKLFGNGNSTPRENVSNIQTYISDLSPIACKISCLNEDRDEKLIFSDLKMIQGQNTCSKLSSQFSAELIAQKSTLTDAKTKHGIEKKNVMNSLYNKSTNVDPTCFASEQDILQIENGNIYLLNFSKKEVSTEKYVNLGIETDDFLCDNMFQVVKCQNTYAALHAENKSDTHFKQINRSTQTEESIVIKEGEYLAEKCSSTVALRHSSEGEIDETKTKLDDVDYLTIDEDRACSTTAHSHESFEQELRESFETRYNQCLMKVKRAFSTRLRIVGVDPNWTSITNKVSEKTNSLLDVRRVNMSKVFRIYTGRYGILPLPAVSLLVKSRKDIFIGFYLGYADYRGEPVNIYYNIKCLMEDGRLMTDEFRAKANENFKIIRNFKTVPELLSSFELSTAFTLP